MNLIIGLIIFVALLAIWFISVGNRLNRYLVTIEESKRTVDIVLVKRYDTISEMLKVAKAYAKHEKRMEFKEKSGERKKSRDDRSGDGDSRGKSRDKKWK